MSRPRAKKSPAFLVGVTVGVLSVLGVVLFFAGRHAREREVQDCFENRNAASCRNACALGEEPSCKTWHEIECNRENRGDREARLSHCTLACDAADADSCEELADDWKSKGFEATTPVARAEAMAKRIDALVRACSKTGSRPCMALAREANDSRGMSALEDLCARRAPSWCTLLAYRRAYGYKDAPPVPGDTPIFPRDVSRALAILEHHCDAGVHGACEDAGSILLLGDGVPRDDARAYALYSRALGSEPDATHDPRPLDIPLDMNRAGAGHAWMLEKGIGVAQDDTAATRELIELCSDGSRGGYPHRASCLDLAYKLGIGHGSPEDASLRTKLIHDNCTWRTPCWLEAHRREIGWFRPKDLARAIGYYEMACTLAREERACSILGLKTVRGDGVDKNDERGMEMLRDGCRLGDESGCAALRPLGEDPSELEEEGRRVRAERAREF